MTRSAPLRFAVYSSSQGNYFFSEIRHLLAAGLRELGFDAIEVDERNGWLAQADRHLVVGPQEFFYAGGGERLRLKSWPASVVLYDAEQPGCAWSGRFDRLLPRASATWAMDVESSRRRRAQGWRSAWVPLGWVDGCDYFESVRELPRIPLTRKLGKAAGPFDTSRGNFEGRPLDLLFVGSRVRRREDFFDAAAPRLTRYRGFVRLANDSRPLRPRQPDFFTKALLGLAQRSKIVLNIHRRNTPFFEWHRVALHGLAQGALVISEPTRGARPLRPGIDFVEAELSEIPDAIDHFLGSASGRNEARTIAARGRASFERCRLSRFLSEAMRTLASPLGPDARRTRRRTAAAQALLESSLS